VILLATHALIWWANGELLPLEPAVAVAVTRLPESFHADPADRCLVAQARELAVPLLSADRRIRDYPHGQSLW
jgi:PIN domain nuclease of toxin-antitoxin system